jgi:MFS superfamily sulfate permease-like transporter
MQQIPRSDGKATFRMHLAEEVSFLNKATIMTTLNNVEEGSTIIVDASNSKTIDHDVIEVIQDFTVNAKRRNIHVEVTGLNAHLGSKKLNDSVRQVSIAINRTETKDKEYENAH